MVSAPRVDSRAGLNAACPTQSATNAVVSAQCLPLALHPDRLLRVVADARVELCVMFSKVCRRGGPLQTPTAATTICGKTICLIALRHMFELFAQRAPQHKCCISCGFCYFHNFTGLS